VTVPRIYKDAWGIEKEKNTKIQGKCLEDSPSVYTEVVNILQNLDLRIIKPEIPITSGIIDLIESKDPFANLLSLGTKQILTKHSFHIMNFPIKLEQC
ncbi:17221_t:CDS:2, partial [Entrophospora sp. SA101]